MTTITTYKHIVSSPNIVGGKPRIDGHRITVQDIVSWHERMGYSVEEIASLYNLTLAEIYSALAYYFDHKNEIDSTMAESERFVAEMRQRTPSLIAKKLFERIP